MSNPMLQAFKDFLKNLIEEPENKVFLLAVSGGPDSMAMTHLFLKAGLKFSVAHCNFGLRGAESDREEVFVKEWMQQHGIKVYTRKFNTRAFAEEKGLSVQLAARELRYSWFEELRQNIPADFIATAHHLDDSRETLIINILRGTGIAGLAGIPALTGNIVRPLLFTTRNKIEEYLEINNIPFVTDSSNLHTDYLRNQLRLEIIPALLKAWPGWDTSFPDTLARLSFAANIFQQKIKEEKEKRFRRSGPAWHIITDEIQPGEAGAQLLYELLKIYGFNLDQTREIALALTKNSGRTFFSNTHRISTERGFLELIEISPKDSGLFIEVEPDTSEVLAGRYILRFNRIDIKDFRGFSPGNQTAWFDFHKLNFPLILRNWRPGDRIQPLGMEGWQKLSDLFIQYKLSKAQKESLPLLCCGEEVVWIPGLRSSGRFKVDSHTRLIFKAEISEER
ncbi:MAG: tRNA lysidine(34) synthetase TilS [Bacteroidales bacterium]|nr:tRNA lysidine(34) synthetase TilS [Bacteroidales bacterium]